MRPFEPASGPVIADPPSPPEPLTNTSPPWLFRTWPGLAQALPHVPLACFPTPIEHLVRLGGHLGCELLIKRDDLTSPLYGGNKVRKLEHLLAAALHSGASGVWTVGGSSSHHALATARFGSHLGLSTSVVTFPQSLTPHAQRVRAALEEGGCQVWDAPSRAAFPLHLCRFLSRSWLEGKRLFRIPAGGSNALGTLGHVSAGLELCHQVSSGQAPRPDLVVVALGSCGTAAGLFLGLTLGGLPCTLVGVRITDAWVANRANILRLALASFRLLVSLLPDSEGRAVTRRLLDALRGRGPVRLEVVKDQLGEGYGEPTSACLEAMQLAQSHEGLHLDPTYTAKAMAHVIRSRPSPKERQTFLYWHTLGDEGRARETVD